MAFCQSKNIQERYSCTRRIKRKKKFFLGLLCFPLCLLHLYGFHFSINICAVRPNENVNWYQQRHYNQSSECRRPIPRVLTGLFGIQTAVALGFNKMADILQTTSSFTQNEIIISWFKFNCFIVYLVDPESACVAQEPVVAYNRPFTSPNIVYIPSPLYNVVMDHWYNHMKYNRNDDLKII